MEKLEPKIETKSESEKEIIRVIENGPIDFSQDQTDILLILQGLKPAIDISISSETWREGEKKKVEMLDKVDYSKVTELKGSIGSLGECRGKAFVFYWSDDVAKKIKKMPKDSILVAPQTHPTYMPAISIAKGLVVDEGGITGHAAVVARELNKPCVIGIHIATKAIQTGDELEVDANNGIVKILRRALK